MFIPKTSHEDTKHTKNTEKDRESAPSLPLFRAFTISLERDKILPMGGKIAIIGEKSMYNPLFQEHFGFIVISPPDKYYLTNREFTCTHLSDVYYHTDSEFHLTRYILT